MADEVPLAKKVCLSIDSLEKLSKEELITRCMDFAAFAERVATDPQASSRNSTVGISASELTALKESEEKLRQQHADGTRRENILIKTLTSKEQELAECASQIEELKQYQLPSNAQLRTVQLDPTVNHMFQRMQKELDANKLKLEEAQNELSAWKFTPDSQTGKRLMARCRMLIQENEELGKQISSGRIAKLEGDIALLRALIAEMKASQAETDDYLMELDGEMEGMQSTVYLLQQQLKEAKEQNTSLRSDNLQLTARCSRAEAATALATLSESVARVAELSEPHEQLAQCRRTEVATSELRTIAAVQQGIGSCARPGGATSSSSSASEAEGSGSTETGEVVGVCSLSGSPVRIGEEGSGRQHIDHSIRTSIADSQLQDEEDTALRSPRASEPADEEMPLVSGEAPASPTNDAGKCLPSRLRQRTGKRSAACRDSNEADTAVVANGHVLRVQALAND